MGLRRYLTASIPITLILMKKNNLDERFDARFSEIGTNYEDIKQFIREEVLAAEKEATDFWKNGLAEYLNALEAEGVFDLGNRIRNVFGLFPPNYTQSSNFTPNITK